MTLKISLYLTEVGRGRNCWGWGEKQCYNSALKNWGHGLNFTNCQVNHDLMGSGILWGLKQEGPDNKKEQRALFLPKQIINLSRPETQHNVHLVKRVELAWNFLWTIVRFGSLRMAYFLFITTLEAEPVEMEKCKHHTWEDVWENHLKIEDNKCLENWNGSKIQLVGLTWIQDELLHITSPCKENVLIYQGGAELC